MAWQGTCLAFLKGLMNCLAVMSQEVMHHCILWWISVDNIALQICPTWSHAYCTGRVLVIFTIHWSSTLSPILLAFAWSLSAIASFQTLQYRYKLKSQQHPSHGIGMACMGFLCSWKHKGYSLVTQCTPSCFCLSLACIFLFWWSRSSSHHRLCLILIWGSPVLDQRIELVSNWISFQFCPKAPVVHDTDHSPLFNWIFGM